MIESRKSRGDVAGPSPIWLKLGVVRRLDPKPPKMTLFYVVRTVGGDLEGSQVQRGEKMRYMFSTIAPTRGVQSKYCFISTLITQHLASLTSKLRGHTSRGRILPGGLVLAHFIT